MQPEQFYKLRKGDLLVPAEKSSLPEGTYWFLEQAWLDESPAVVLDGSGIVKPRTVLLDQVDLEPSVDQEGRVEIFPPQHWDAAVGLGNPATLHVRVLESLTSFPNPLIYHGYEVINGETYVKVGEPERVLGFLQAGVVKLVQYVP